MAGSVVWIARLKAWERISSAIAAGSWRTRDTQQPVIRCNDAGTTDGLSWSFSKQPCHLAKLLSNVSLGKHIYLDSWIVNFSALNVQRTKFRKATLD